MSDILSIGASGISAYRKSLEVTGNNIANANTDGYVHRDAALSTAGVGPSSPLTITTQSGTGVSVDVIKRASDTFLRDAVWSANAASSQAQALATSMGQLERRILMPTSTVSTSMQKFFSNIQDIANSPSSMSARTAALTGAQQIVDQFHSQISSINQEISFAETNINTVLTSLNGFTGQIAKLNASIAASTGSAQQPNDLLDQRDKLINQLSQLVSIKVSEEPSGKVTVYLGDSTGGAKLVEGISAHKLGSQVIGQRLDFVFDPGGTNATTNQVTSGTLAGLQLYRSQCIYTRDSFNRLAVAFASNMNSQHVQGVDLSGNKGRELFSTDTLSGVPSKSNQGDAKLTIDPASMGTVSSDTYVATYDAPTQQWTVTAQLTKRTVSGTGDLTLDGLKFHFEGNAKSGDNFTVNPLQDAAAGIRLLITDPTQWAMSLPIYADTDPSNAGTASVAINKSNQTVSPPSLPQIQSVFSQSQTPGGAIGVKADGVVSLIPAGASNVTLSSLRTLPSASFGKDMKGNPLDPNQLMLGMKQNYSPVVSLAINDGNSLKTIKLDFNADLQNYLASTPDAPYVTNDPHIFDGLNSGSIDGLADAINADLKIKGYGEQFVASAVNGVLTINALGPNQIVKASMASQFIVDAKATPSQLLSLDGTVESGFGGTNLQLFTREGRQLSGPVLSPEQAKKLLTVANGFLSDAVYMPPLNTEGYRNISISKSSAPLTVSINKDLSTSVQVAAYPQTDGVQATDNHGAAIAGAVYDFKLPAGFQPIRLAGQDILGKSATDIASLLETRLTQQASVQSVRGQPIDWGVIGEGPVQFAVNVNGANQTISMVRNSVVSANQPMVGNGPFSIDVTINSKDYGSVKQTFQLTRVVDANGNPTSSVKAEPVPYSDTWGKLSAGWSKDINFFVNPDGKLSIDLPREVGSGVNDLTIAGTDSDALGITYDAANSNILASVGNDAQFSSDGLPPLTITIVHQNGQDYLNFALPQSLAAEPMSFNLSDKQTASSTQLSALGLQPTAVADQASSAYPTNLDVTYLGNTYTITLNGPAGDDSANGRDISWYTGSDGKLRLTSKASDFSVAANSTLGFSADTNPSGLAYSLTGTGVSKIDLSAQNGSALNVYFNGAYHKVTIGPLQDDGTGTLVNNFDATDPNKIYPSDTAGISWSVDQSGHVTIHSSYNDLKLAAQSEADQTASTGLGFMGAGLSLQRVESKLTFISTIRDGINPVPPSIDTSLSISRVADTLTLSGAVPEDLIVAVQSSNVKTSVPVNGIAGEPVQAIQTITIPANLQMSDTVSFDIPGMNFNGPLYITGAQSVVDLSSILQNKINNSGVTLKPTVSYDSSKNQLVVTFADTGYKPLITSSIIRGNAQPESNLVHSVNNGVKPGSGISEVQTLQSTLPISVGDTFNVTLKLTPNDTDLQSFNLKISNIPPNQDFVSQLNIQIAKLAGIDATKASIPSATAPSDAWPVWATNDNGVITLKWRDSGDVPPVSIAQTNDISSVKRSLIASYPTDITRQNPVAPDFNVKVIAPGKLELFDKASGASLATRSYTVGQPVDYMGMSFTINGNASVGDRYTITSDTTRTGDNRNAVLIASLQSKDALGQNSGTFQDIYAAMSTQLSSTTQAANDTSTSAQASVASLQSAYDGKTGVSLDTEAANLLRFQQAYQASAEVINTAKTLFDTIYKIM